MEKKYTDPSLPISPTSGHNSIAHLQRQLTQCGFVAVDPIGIFGPSTRSQLRGFQRKNGVDPTGICDSNTWQLLVESHWNLGDRLLYLKTPMMRGNDVAQLQGRLSWLGFDAGAVDGVFGTGTLNAVTEFQLNVGLAGDGICGKETVIELNRNIGRSQMTVSAFKEQLRLADFATDLLNRKIAISGSIESSAIVEDVRVRLRQGGYIVTSFTHYNYIRLAHAINSSSCDLVIHLEISRSNDSSIEYFKGYHQTSPIGQSLAQALHIALLQQIEKETVTIEGTTHQILQLTKAPAISFSISKPLLHHVPWPTITEIIATTLSCAFI